MTEKKQTGLAAMLSKKTQDLNERITAHSGPSIADLDPITMPGKLSAFRLEAQRYQNRIDELEKKLQEIEQVRGDPETARRAAELEHTLAQERAAAAALEAAAVARERELQSALEQSQRAHQSIPLDQLHEVEGRRRRLSNGQLVELVDNLRNNDLITPITVRPRTEGGFEIISGHNRVAAYRELGRPAIEAVIRDLDEDKTVLGAFYANLLQPSLPDYEKYLGFKLIQSRHPELTQNQIAQMAGVSASMLSRLLAFDDLPDEVRAVLAAHPDTLGARAASTLSALAKEGKAPRLLEAVQKAVTMGDWEQAELIAFASKTDNTTAPAKKKITVTKVKVGKAPLCSYRIVGATLRVDFVSDTHAEAVREEIQSVLERYAASLKSV